MSPDHKIAETARQDHFRKLRAAAGATADPRINRWKSIILANLSANDVVNRLDAAKRSLTSRDANFANLPPAEQELKTLELVLISLNLKPSEC